MNRLLLASLFALMAANPAIAAPHQQAGHDMSSHPAHAATYPATGVVKAVKPGKVQIAHDPIPSLGWPAMTMWFDLETPPAADLAVGTRVQFEIRQGDNKKWEIEKITRQ
ncbi:MAG: hypothetical protein Fur0040_03360 [Sideroxydans sp.]